MYEARSHKLHRRAQKKSGCIPVSQLHKQMHLKQKKATQMDASSFLKLHKEDKDASKQEQSFRQSRPTQSNLQAA
jgi:hypothetical protein